MKLLTEYVSHENIEIITEGEASKKVYKLKGPFVAAEVRNQNGRLYPKAILEREIKKYNEEKIKTGQAVGTLDHGQSPQIDSDRVSHKIESMEMIGNEGIGVLKLIDTPCGDIAKKLVDEGIRLGISSRGVGTLTPNKEVQESYKLISCDLVLNPSYQKAFLESVLESKDYYVGEDGLFYEGVENLKNKVDKNYKSDLIFLYIKEFFGDIRKKYIKK